MNSWNKKNWFIKVAIYGNVKTPLQVDYFSSEQNISELECFPLSIKRNNHIIHVWKPDA